jgi:hypothetical protein
MSKEIPKMRAVEGPQWSPIAVMRINERRRLLLAVRDGNATRDELLQFYSEIRRAGDPIKPKIRRKGFKLFLVEHDRGEAQDEAAKAREKFMP